MGNSKNHFSVEVCGVPLNIVTDESEEFLFETAEKLSDQISYITKNMFCVSKLDAAILCALDSMGEADKAKEQIRTLEAKLSVLEMDLANLREETDSLRDRVSPSKPNDYVEANDKMKSLESFLGGRING